MEQAFVDPKVLKANPWNSNHVDLKNREKLRKSIRKFGFTSAIVVRTLDDGTLQILGGQHRSEIAVEEGIAKVPVLNLGKIPDAKAKQIGLIDNSRYGADDALQLARIIEDLKLEDTDSLTDFLPMQAEDLQAIMRAVEIDVDTLDVLPTHEDEEDPYEALERPERAARTHDMMTFRVPVREAELIRVQIEKTIKREGLDDGSDDKTLAGYALAHLLLNGGKA